MRKPQNYHNRKIRQSVRKNVWARYVGLHKGWTLCYCCGSCYINPFEFECGHIKARSRGGSDEVTNLRPICSLCNKSMGATEMGEFIKNCGYPVKRSWLDKVFTVLKLINV